MGTVVGVVKGVASRMKAWGGSDGSAVFNVAAACTKQRNKNHFISPYLQQVHAHTQSTLYMYVVIMYNQGY